MPVVNLNSLAKPKNISNKPQFTYADVEVDFEFEQTQQVELYSNLKKYDLRGNYNLGAIKNSIINIFTSFPGDKILNPEFGCNLNQFLFKPISTDMSRIIGEYIKNQILRQESRVKPLKITVIGLPQQNQYNITLVLEVPFINNDNILNINATLNSTGINFYN